MSEGWICPSCKRGVAPGERTCDHGASDLKGRDFLPFDPFPGLPMPIEPQRHPDYDRWQDRLDRWPMEPPHLTRIVD